MYDNYCHIKFANNPACLIGSHPIVAFHEM
jgi:hypothetical protein